MLSSFWIFCLQVRALKGSERSFISLWACKNCFEFKVGKQLCLVCLWSSTVSGGSGRGEKRGCASNRIHVEVLQAQAQDCICSQLALEFRTQSDVHQSDW